MKVFGSLRHHPYLLRGCIALLLCNLAQSSGSEVLAALSKDALHFKNLYSEGAISALIKSMGTHRNEQALQMTALACLTAMSRHPDYRDVSAHLSLLFACAGRAADALG